MLSGPGTAGGAADAPRPDLAPEAVVRAVLSALAATPDVDGPGPDDPAPNDDGVARFLAFAAPRLQQRLGGRAHARRALRNPLNRPLLAHARVELEPLQRVEHAARQRFTVTTASGERASFLMSLARQRSGELRDCWLVTGLVREEAAYG